MIPFQYDGAGSFSDGAASVVKDDNQQLINKAGQGILSLNQYDGLSRFSCGLATVQKDGKYGFINKTGKVVIPLRYDMADTFMSILGKHCIAMVVVQNEASESGVEAFIIDTKGKHLFSTTKLP